MVRAVVRIAIGLDFGDAEPNRAVPELLAK
jgi:hypothetical protein